MSETFDVFLSHNSKDKPVVRQIAARLQEEYGLACWLDVDALRPGHPFQDGLQQAILETPAAAVFVGNHGQGPWQRVEVRSCLSQMVKHGKPVIPVLLEGAPDEPDIGLFLGEITWVDLRDGLAREGLDRLVWGITGRKPGPRKKAAPAEHEPEILLEEAPELTRHFQGREQEVESCLDALRTSRLVTITGLAGTGKTELSLAVAQEVLRDPALRLGEANTLQGLGTLANAHAQHTVGFNLLLQALHIQRSVLSVLGEGGSFGYLARTARAANPLERAVVLGGQAWRLLEGIGDRFGQRLALDDLVACFIALNEDEAAGATFLLAWHLAHAMGEPSMEHRREALRQILPDFTPEAEPIEG